jgi:hypothetical protein
MIRNMLIDPLISDNSELMVFRSEVDEDSVTLFGSLHSQFMEYFDRPLYRIDLTIFLDMHPDLSGCVQFSFSDRLNDALLIIG